MLAASGMEADVGELIAQALAASRPRGEVSTPDVATRAEEAREELSGEADSEGPSTWRGMAGIQERAADEGASRGERVEVEGVEGWMWYRREWREVCPGSRAQREWCTPWSSTRAPAVPDCQTTCGHGWKWWKRRGAEALTSDLWRPFPRGRSRRQLRLRLGGKRRECGKRRAWRMRRRTSPANRRWPSCTRMTPGPTSTPAWMWARRTRRYRPCPPRCRLLPWGD